MADSGTPSSTMSASRQTPAMQQYYRFKRRHPDCVLLFRIGDFYEMFDDDAVAVSKAIGLTLTQRTEGIPMAGVPYHQLETYLRKLIAAGFRVAVCEQVQDAAEAKGVVDRAVTQVLTPGTLVDDALLAPDAVSRLAAVAFLEAGDSPRAAAAVADLASGSFVLLDCGYEALADELARRSVTELLFAQTATGETPARAKVVLEAIGLAGTPRPAWQFRAEEALQAVLEQFQVATLAGFGVAEDDPAIGPAGAVIRYLLETQAPGAAEGDAGARRPAAGVGGRVLAHLLPPKREAADAFVGIDATSLRALEVLRTLRSGEVAGSLLGVFASGPAGTGCRTPMGRRLLRDWLCRPPVERARIESRQRAVAILVEDRRGASALSGALSGVQDVMRIGARLALGRASPRDLVALGRSLGQVKLVMVAIGGAPALKGHADRLAAVAGELAPLAERIAAQCVESPPAHLREGGLIRDGIDAELDEARGLQRDATGWLAEYQKTLVEAHSLPSLKVGYNKVFGYYIELPKAQARSAPAAFTRKQTLTSAERFITPELKAFEDKVTTAQARAVAREQALFDGLCGAAGKCIAAIAAFAEVCAELDVVGCFADKAVRRGWVRPEIVEAPVLEIVQGRHPVLDELLGSNFVPNDVELGSAEQETRSAEQEGEETGPRHGSGARLALITGPNMAGKSTFIRQAALLVLLAHTGSFVPAQRAVVGVTDRIFTRVGADDALHAGQSTFMVEMTETARILHHATDRSLVILDEIGRGTSTLDGLALAWAIAERLAVGGGQGGRGESGGDGGARPRTLFATHYHELTELEERLGGATADGGRVKNLYVAVREWGDSIVFLHRILPGRTSQSYGIHVAKLAGIPEGTVRRAREVLESLAVHSHELGASGAAKAVPAVSPGGGANGTGQLSLFTEYLPHPAMEALAELDLDALTPLEAFDCLRKLRAMLEVPPGPNGSGGVVVPPGRRGRSRRG